MKYRKVHDTTDALGRWYDEKYASMGGTWETPAAECNKHLDDAGVQVDTTHTLLDVGCGGGHFLKAAAWRAKCTGIDPSKKAIEYARLQVGSGVRLEATGITEFSRKRGYSFDYIFSIGSLEHIPDLDDALDCIRKLLKSDGRFYFYCPNEKWVHEDQPNERTATDAEWTELFAKHGLYVDKTKRWNDSTAFQGSKEKPERVTVSVPDNLRLNLGSGQRPFTGWVNVDCQSLEGRIPDLECDIAKLPYPDNSAEMCVLHHVIEHFGCGEAQGIIREAWRVLKPGGSLIVTVPDLRALAQGWLMGRIDDQIYKTQLYGAYIGNEADRHKWGFTQGSLENEMKESAQWASVKAFDWRTIPNASLAKDWYIIGAEATK